MYIDEIQFYCDALEVCNYLVNEKDINVVCAGLSGTFDGKIFKNIADLIPVSDKITHLTAVDKMTGETAPFTKRLTNDKNVEVIGGEDMYTASCRSQWNIFN